MAGHKVGKGGRKRHQNLHAMTDNDLLTIDDFLVTAGTTGDSSIGKKMVRLLVQGGGDMWPDSAYLSRLMCDLVDSLGMAPYIWPKKNSASNAKGSHARAAMMRKLVEQPDEFKSHYRARSTVEGVFSALKTRYGNAFRRTNRIASGARSACASCATTSTWSTGQGSGQHQSIAFCCAGRSLRGT